MDKVIFVVVDGLPGRPIKELKNRTPLEAAKTPNFDKLAKSGISGIVDVLGVGKRPGSDTSHLSLFGYPLEKYYHGRGPFEAAGIGMDLRKGDIAMRANIGTVDENLVVVDRRAGRVKDTSPFVEALKGLSFDGVKFFLKPGTAYRIGLVMRGRGLSHKINEPDPHKVGVPMKKAEPLDKSKEAARTAKALQKFLNESHKILKDMPLNKERIKKGLLPGNYIFCRGAGYIEDVPSFEKRYSLKACCVAGAGLYKGVGKIVGMDLIDVSGATGLPDTNVSAKFRAAKKALKEHDFVFVHVKAADSLAEDGNVAGKKEFIEKIDKALPLLSGLSDTLLVFTADHSTPCSLKTHSGDPVPIIMSGDGVRADDVKTFGEREAAKGGMGRIRGLDVMPEILNLLGKAELIGA